MSAAPIVAVLTIYNSRRDMYGNVYHAVKLHSRGDDVEPVQGAISAENVDTRDCRELLGWYIERQELPIREFNRLTKSWPHFGCRWGQIKSNLLGAPHWTFTSDSCGYMLYHDGEPQGGARTLGTATHTADGRRRHWRHIRADTKENAELARNICDARNRNEVKP